MGRWIRRLGSGALMTFCAAWLASCSGASVPAPSVVPQTGTDTRALPAGFGELTIALPPIVPPAAAIGSPATAGLSSATSSLSGTFGSHRLYKVKLSQRTRGCEKTSAGLSCSVTFRLRAGKGTLTLVTNAVRGIDAPLATASMATTVVAGKNVRVTPVWTGIATSFGLSIAPADFAQGVPGSAKIALYGIDAAGAIIPSSNIRSKQFGTKLRWKPFASGTYPNQFKATDRGGEPWKARYVFTYDGTRSGSETIEARAGADQSVTLATATIRFNPPAAQLFVWNGPAYDGGPAPDVVQFAASASGNTAPLRSFSPTGTLLAADASGGYWTLISAYGYD
ncbi:MAG TPA: hypothetical protein VK760_02840, partial [Candidatus Acidoferrales bacterium]|nr:hypothetical protein [Candidatus Acidoferrales bacterium]